MSAAAYHKKDVRQASLRSAGVRMGLDRQRDMVRIDLDRQRDMGLDRQRDMVRMGLDRQRDMTGEFAFSC